MLIHIGKCGGSNITKKFLEFHAKKIKCIHCKKPSLHDISRGNNICVLLRDPITRFVSIFFYWYTAYEKLNAGEKVPHLTETVRLSQIFDVFKTPNQLAEALVDDELRSKVIPFFVDCTHMRCNFEFYLQDENLIKLLKTKNLYIIRQEHYEEDFAKYYNFMVKTLNIKTPNFEGFMENKSNNTNIYNDKKYLSPLAIENLKKEFEREYKIFDLLVKYGLITQEYLDSFI